MAVLTMDGFRYGMLWLCLVLLPPAVRADDSPQLAEKEIKAGLLYNFLKYTSWPAVPEAMTLCIFGDDPFDGYAQPMAGRTVNQRRIVIRTVRAVEDTQGCQLVFVNAAEKTRWPRLLKFLRGRPVLTVSDFADFAASGGMIEFARLGDHISVRLNMDAVATARLAVQDRLLKLVTVVHSAGG